MGSDELLIYNYSKDEKTREEFLSMAKEISKEIDIPFSIGWLRERLEIQKLFATGARAVIIDIQYSKINLLKEATGRFGSENHG